MSTFAHSIMQHKYAHELSGGKETWENIAYRATKHPLKAVGVTMRDKLAKDICHFITERKFLPGGRYLYASGRPFHQTQNCLLMRAIDSREGWAELLHNASTALMTGAGIGVDYSDIRHKGSLIRKTGGTATGPIALMQMLNECGRGIMQGGSRRSAIWAGLSWKHADVHEFIRLKNWSSEIKSLKERDFNFPATLDQTNISVLLDDDFFEAYKNSEHDQHSQAHSIYWSIIEQMLSTGEPGFSIDIGKNSGETLRNACTEVTSRDDSDICNLGSLNLARIESVEEMKEVTEAAVAYLLSGTVYSDVPYARVDQVRTKNRRLGLGIMGVHEWLLNRGKPYGPDEELEEWLKEYAKSGIYAKKYAKEWDLSVPKKTRAVAPTGTIGILAETTTGIEPIFCVAFKRRYLKGDTWHYQYVIDPTAKRLITKGVSPESIEDAYSLTNNIERRVAFQSWVQQYVDHGISSTINLPSWGSEKNNSGLVMPFGSMLMEHLPSLRGITAYPDGARGGQPLVPVAYEEAIKHEGTELIEQSMDVCSLKSGGSCGE
ncbi:MAG: hypothetical protein MN733_24730 [Nitrososphaera sp.]|nr:hypothetical protein [Nitrososphaera sp.]